MTSRLSKSGPRHTMNVMGYMSRCAIHFTDHMVRLQIMRNTCATYLLPCYTLGGDATTQQHSNTTTQGTGMSCFQISRQKLRSIDGIRRMVEDTEGEAGNPAGIALVQLSLVARVDIMWPTNRQDMIMQANWRIWTTLESSPIASDHE